MFHVIAPRSLYHVFTYDDPRKDGFDGEIQEDVSLEEPRNVHDWPDGEARPEACLGDSLDDERRYRVFKSADDCRRAGFRLLGSNYLYFQSWARYLKLEDR
jgi:hypothetical protein